jgi:hypothetical protein
VACELAAAVGAVLGFIGGVERKARLLGERAVGLAFRITGPDAMMTPSAAGPAMRIKSMLAAPWFSYCLWRPPLLRAIDAEWVNALAVAFSRLAYAATVTVGAVMAVIGLLRKLHLGRWSAAGL